VTEAPCLFSLAEVAERLHKSPRWMQEFLRDKPFGRMAGRTRLFTEADIAAIIEALPAAKSYAEKAGYAAHVAPASPALLAKAEKLLAADKRTRSGRRPKG
jgi:hypothetical protein